MKWIAASREWLRGLVFRGREESDMDEELRFHIQMEAARLQRAEGLAPDEAQRRAAASFGGIERYKEEVREARGIGLVTGAWLDFKLGARLLRKYPAMTAVGGVGLAVGVAMSVGMFAFISAHIFAELPLDEGARIVALENRDIEVNNEDRRALHDFVLWRDQLTTVRQLGAFRNVQDQFLVAEGPPVPVQIAEMTASGFQVARVPPLLGRYLIEADEQPGAPPVLVIGHGIWQRRFAGDPDVIGREVRLDGVVHTIVGVMPEGFAFPMTHVFWTPLRVNPADYERRQGPSIYIFGRLAPGVTLEEAQAELTAIGQRTAAAFPETHETIRPMVMPYTHSLTDIQGITVWEVAQMQLMMSFVLIVVALNVSVLVYARTATRQGEIAVRTALGASRGRIVTQLFAEALVLSLLASALGVGLAQLGVSLGNGIMETEQGRPFWLDYGLQPATVLLAVGIAIVIAVIVGLIPALQATGRRLQNNLRDLGGTTGMRLGATWTVLIVTQVAIAVAVLPVIVNMGWSEVVGAMSRPIYEPQDYLISPLGPERIPEQRARSNATSSAAESDRPFGDGLTEVLRRLKAEPAVVGATYETDLSGRVGLVEVDGVPAPPESPMGHRTATDGVGPNYLELYGADILTGRAFEPGDLDGNSTAVIVNRAFVNQVLGGGEALGRRIRFINPERFADTVGAVPPPWFEIVGVAENLRTAPSPELVRPEVFYPVAPAQAQGVALVVRVSGARATEFAGRMREVVTADPAVRLGYIRSLQDSERQGQLAIMLVALMIGLVMVSVFLLSAAGIYALTSFTVTRRRREIGIRTALGAHAWQVLRGVFARVALQIALGVVVGILAAAVLDRMSGGDMLGGRSGILLPVFAVVMALVALLASFGPVRRGLRVAPSEALRAEG